MFPPTTVCDAAGGDDFAGQRRRRCLAVRAGDGDDRARKERAASSISPMTVSPALRACTSGGTSTGTPGLTTMRSCPRKVRSPCRRFRPRFRGRAARNLLAQFVLRLGVGNGHACALRLQKDALRPRRTCPVRRPVRVCLCRSKVLLSQREQPKARSRAASPS